MLKAMQMEKNILIVSYDFPPSKNVGARRWGKFAKYLSKAGYKVHVICSKRHVEENSLWADTLDSLNIYELPLNYPPIFDTVPDTFFKKVNYKLWCKLLEMYSKGTIYDRALFWKDNLIKEASDIIVKHSISNVICTGAPFRLLYYVLQLKKQFPKLNVISDLRDPWTWGHGYGYSILPAEKLAYEKMMEKYTMMYSDKVVAPAEEMIAYLGQQYSFYRHKFVLLPHGYDSYEILPKKKEHVYNTKRKLIFYGSIYEYLDKIMGSLAKVFKEHQDALELDFFSDSQNYKSIFEENGVTNVSYNKVIPSHKLFERFLQTDFILIIYPPYAKNILSTKFFEIIYSRTPIIYIGEGGFTSNFIVENKLGIYIHPDHVEEGMKKICTPDFRFDYNYNFDVSNFSFEKLTQKLESLFN